MRIFRNPEWKRLLFICLGGSALLSLLGLRISRTCFLFALFVCVFLSVLSLFLYARHLSRISSLTRYVENVLRGEAPVPLGHSREGEYAILKNELYKLSQALKTQLEETARERQRLSEALSDISHQIKTPLTALNIECQLLRGENNTPEERVRLIRSMDSQLQRVEKLVEMLLKMSRMDAEAVQFSEEDCAADELLQKALSPILIPLELREIALRTEGNKEDALNCDPAWTAEALGAILKNCMEHTPMGGEIAIFHQETPLLTRVIIENSGLPFDSDDLPHLFERFYRGKNAAPGGAGIGLSFARQVILRQGGMLTAKNVQGRPRFIAVFYKHTI